MHEWVLCCDEAANYQLPIAVAFWIMNHPNSFRGGMFKLNTKFDTLLAHFECDSHTVHMLSQWCLPPPPTSTVKSSLFTHGHSSLLSLAGRLHQCCAKHSHTNNRWTFSGQTLYILCLSFSFWGTYYCLFLWYKNAMQTEQGVVGESCFEILRRMISQQTQGFLSARISALFDNWRNEHAERVSDLLNDTQLIGGQIRTKSHISWLWLLVFPFYDLTSVASGMSW